MDAGVVGGVVIRCVVSAASASTRCGAFSWAVTACAYCMFTVLLLRYGFRLSVCVPWDVNPSFVVVVRCERRLAERR